MALSITEPPPRARIRSGSNAFIASPHCSTFSIGASGRQFGQVSQVNPPFSRNGVIFLTKRLLNGSVTMKARFLGHRAAKVSMVDGPIAIPVGKTFAPMNILGMLKMLVRPLMEEERDSGTRDLSMGSSNQ